MLKSRFDWIILIFTAVLLGTVWIVYSQETTTGPGSADGLSEAPAPGYVAPNFTLTTSAGETITLSELRGQPVVLNFWATWCPPCRAEMPFFQSASLNYNGRATILGVNQGENLSAITSFGRGMGISYPLLLDEDNLVNGLYNVRALPTTIFVDANGIIAEIVPGVINQAVLEDRIEELVE